MKELGGASTKAMTMFASETVLGELTDPQGSLKVGNAGDTECTFLSYKSVQGDREFTVVYTARQLSSLVAAAKKGIELSPNAKPRSTIRLGAITGRAIQLQIVFVAPENKSPLIIFRFVGDGWKQDIFSPPPAMVELLQKAQRRAPMPGVVGILDRFGSNIWMIEGQTLEVDDKLSQGTGFYGEYIHHSEVAESTVVRAWPLTIEGKQIVVAFEFAQAWEPGGTPDLPQGQSGDQALQDGLVRQSKETHALLSKTMYESGRVDDVWAAKVALASLTGDLLMSDDKGGQATWSGEGGNPILKAGIQKIRGGGLSPHDCALFAMISAYHLTSMKPGPEAVPAIDGEMVKAWNYAKFNAPEMKRLVLNNWNLLLQKANRGATAGPAFAKFEEAKSDFDGKLRATVFSLPPTFPWVKTWQPAKTKAEPEPAPPAAATAPPAASEPLPTLKPIPDQPPLPTALEFDKEPEDEKMEGEAVNGASPWNDSLMSLEDEPAKKKLPMPLIIGALVLIGGPIAYYATKSPSPDPTPSPTPTVAVTQTPTPPPKPTQTPVNTSAPIPGGKISINGFSLDGKLRDSDLKAAGYKAVEVADEKDSGIALFKGPDGGEIIVNYTLPTRLITAIQGNKLEVKGQTVANLDSLPASWSGDKRFSKYKIQAVIDHDNAVRAFTFAKDGIYVPEPLLGSAPRSLELSRKISDKNFFESLPNEVANMRMTDGSPILFKYLGSFETGRLQYLLEKGADPNARSWHDGNTALHECHNVKSAEILLAMGADPTLVNDEGKTPFQAAPTEELKQLFDPDRKPEPTPTPTTTPSPNVSATPATPSPSATP